MISFRQWQINESKIIPWLYGLILIGTIFRFCYPFFSNPLDHLYSDPARHYYNSYPGNFGDHRIESIFDPVLPQLELMAVFFLFGNTVFGLATYFGLLSAVMPWFWYRWARELFSTKLQALIFTTVIVFLPSWISIYCYSQDETLLLPLLGAALWLSWRAKRKKTAASFLLACFLWSVTICVKMNTFFEAIIVIAWLTHSFLNEHRLNRKTALVVLSSGLIFSCAYFSPSVWSYHCLGVASLFPPAFNPNNKAAYLSNALLFCETFTSKGKVKCETGYYCSNGTVAHSLEPFSEWASWREGRCNTFIDCDKKLYITIPAPRVSFKKHLLLLVESVVHYFVSPSWPDDREDDFIQNTQVQMRWLWPLLILAVIVLAIIKRRTRNILVLMTVGCALAYSANETIIVEGRYRKPWEGIAIATFIYLLSTANTNKQRVIEKGTTL